MIKAILVLILISFMFGIAGEGDLKEQIEFQDIYCEKVRAGIWGNYKDIDCNKKLAKL